MRVERIGNATLYLGDCLEILPTLDPFDVVVSDPPYGIAFDFSKPRKNRKGGLSWGAKGDTQSESRWAHNVVGDDQPFDPAPWIQQPAILWGANHYAQLLPNSPSWLVWDKRDGTASDNHSDCEMAWTNLGGPARLYRHLWRGIVRAGAENVANGGKVHPAQKPVALMTWCVEKTTGVVLDPYMGSGTTGVACANLGRRFIGVEIQEQHFDIACERIEAAYSQGRLFA